MTSAPYDRFAPFYDLEYGHKENDLDFYLELAETVGSPVLEIGVGTGRVALDLSHNGFEVWGIDNSAEMLKSAQQKLLKQQVEAQARIVLNKADMRNFELKQSFPLCIIPFRGFLHNLCMADQLTTLECIRRHLTPNGILALDLFVPLYQIMSQSTWRDRIEPHELADEQSGITIDVLVQHEPEHQLLNITNTYNDNYSQTQANLTYRYIFRYEMEALLRYAGFTNIEVYGGFEKQAYDYHSGIMVFVAQSIKK